MSDLAGRALTDEEPGFVAPLGRALGDQFRRKLVPSWAVSIRAPRYISAMDYSAVERARERLEAAAQNRTQPGDIDAALDRARIQIEELAALAAQLEASIPAKVGEAVQEGRAEALLVARQVAGSVGSPTRRSAGSSTSRATTWPSATRASMISRCSST